MPDHVVLSALTLPSPDLGMITAENARARRRAELDAPGRPAGTVLDSDGLVPSRLLGSTSERVSMAERAETVARAADAAEAALLEMSAEVGPITRSRLRRASRSLRREARRARRRVG